MSDLIRRKDARLIALEYISDSMERHGALEAIRALPAVQPVTVRLVFNNADATPKTKVVDASAASVPDIMAWYGGYHAGDRYTVAADGRNIPMDQNGEPGNVNETQKSEHEKGDMLTPATKGGCP